MDVIIIETTRMRCHLTKKVIERREVILNTSELFTLDVHHDRITLSGIRSGRNCFGRIEVKTPTGEMIMMERTIYSDQVAESVIDLGDDSEISFVNRKGLLILIHKNGSGQTEEYLVTKEFQGIEIIAKKYLNDDTLSDRIFPCDWQPKPGFRDDAPFHVVALRDPLENYQIRHNNFFYMGLMEEDKVYEICEPFYDSTPIKLLKLKGSFYKIFQGIKMSIVLDSDTLVKLAEHINKGWPNLYQAAVEDKHYIFETLDGNGVKQYRHVNGRLVVRYIPERTSNEPQYHFAAVELCGEITSLEGNVANVEPSSLRLTSSANRGLIKTTNVETGRDIVEYQVQILKERKSHFVQPPGSYCDIPHMFPIEWVSLHHPWQSNPEFVDFNIIGGSTLTQADINSIPAVEDLNEFSRWVVDLVRPIDSFFDDDSLYMDYHQKGLIDDSYRPSTKEW